MSATRSKTRLVISSLLVVFVVGLSAWLFTNRTNIQDQISIWGFNPSPSVESISQDIRLTKAGQRIFYASHPTVDDADSFNQKCPQKERNNPILGCFNGYTISIYNVTESDLAGMQQVTAAHEMLHAVWVRLSAVEQDKLGNLLLEEASKIQAPEFQDRLKYYEKHEPGQLTNELHSIIGTEYAEISDELEAHYARYFKDRPRIVDYHRHYNAVFVDLRNRTDTLYKELTDLAKQIEVDRGNYEPAIDKLTADIIGFNQRAENGGFDSVEQFDRERAQLVTRSNALEVQRVSLNSKIDNYNQRYEDYQELAVRIQSLNGSINSMSSVESAPAVGN